MLTNIALTDQNEKKLVNYLMTRYDKRVRPSSNATFPTSVSFELSLAQLIDVVSTNCNLSLAQLIDVVSTNCNLSLAQLIDVVSTSCNFSPEVEIMTDFLIKQLILSIGGNKYC